MRFTMNGARSVSGRVVLLAGLWWALNPYDLESWAVGAPIVAFSAWVTTRLTPSSPSRMRLSRLPVFFPYFLAASLRGGIDVAWRSLHPRLPIRPTMMEYRLRLPEGTPRIFLINVVNLQPGTLSADFREGILILHSLTDSPAAIKGVRDMELRVADLFGVDLPGG